MKMSVVDPNYGWNWTLSEEVGSAASTPRDIAPGSNRTLLPALKQPWQPVETTLTRVTLRGMWCLDLSIFNITAASKKKGKVSARGSAKGKRSAPTSARDQELAQAELLSKALAKEEENGPIILRRSVEDNQTILEIDCIHGKEVTFDIYPVITRTS